MGGERGATGGAVVAGVARMQARGQFTVPEAVRRATGARPGSTLLVRQTGPDRFEVVVVPRHSAGEFFHAMALRDDLTFEQLREGVAEGVARRSLPPEGPGSFGEAAAAADRHA